MNNISSDMTGEQAESLAALIAPLPLQMRYPFHCESTDNSVIISPAPGGAGFLTNFRYELVGRGILIFPVMQKFNNDFDSTYEVSVRHYRGEAMFINKLTSADDALILSTFRSFLQKSFEMESSGDSDYREGARRPSLVNISFVDSI